ncbi:MAG: pilus assembly protein PilM, partial [Patescibacteria group bacterium]
MPKFLEVPAVGVDISDGSIKFLELMRRKNRFEVGHFGEKFLKDGLVSKGEIKDRQGLVSVLKDIKKETGITSANVSLPEEKAFLFKVNVPNADDESVRTNLSFQIEKKVPISLAEAV